AEGGTDSIAQPAAGITPAAGMGRASRAAAVVPLIRAPACGARWGRCRCRPDACESAAHRAPGVETAGGRNLRLADIRLRARSALGSAGRGSGPRSGNIDGRIAAFVGQAPAITLQGSAPSRGAI